MICANCSAAVADEARFCHSCGSLVSDADGQAAASASMNRSSFRNMEQLLREETKGEFTVHQMIGRGGMAVVYLATEDRLARKVALKVLPPELTFGHGVERFNREARTAAALDHPNIIPIYRISSSEKLFWYAMKYLKGRSLEDLLRENGRFSLEETLVILQQVAEALDYAHEHHVIHRDIKPANVMLDERKRAVVTDFGIAKAIHEGKLTATDSMVGTPYYMSPEQGMGKAITGAADQYSVAVMAYRMLAGHLPFDGASVIDILHKHCMFPAPRLRDAASDIPAHVSVAVARGLSKNAHERFANVEELVNAMRDRKFVPTPVARPSIATQRIAPVQASDAPTVPVIDSTTPNGGAKDERQNRKSYATRKASLPVERPRSRLGRWMVLGAGTVVAAVAMAVLNTKTLVDPLRSQESSLARNQIGELSSPSPAPRSDSTGSSPNMATASPEQPSTTSRTDSNAKAADANVTKPPQLNGGVVTRSLRVPQREVRTEADVAQVPRSPAREPVKAPPVTVDTVRSSTGDASAREGVPAGSPAAAALDTLDILPTIAATIEIDGKNYGEQRRLRELLTAGPHVVRTSKTGFATRTDTVVLLHGRRTTIRPSLERLP